jgi:putative colanic acid biosynthesis acetyltransferase WcaF
MNEVFQRMDSRTTPHGFRGTNKVKVQLWFLVRDLVFRTSPHALNGLRIFLLRLFGAKIAASVTVRPSADIFYPWNVTIGAHSYIGDRVFLYSLDKIRVGAHVSISFGASLCTGTHDYRDPDFPLVIEPIVLEDEVWIGAEAFLCPGAKVKRGGVVGTRSVVAKAVIGEGEVWAGSPARFVRTREMSTKGNLTVMREQL